MSWQKNMSGIPSLTMTTRIENSRPNISFSGAPFLLAWNSSFLCPKDTILLSRLSNPQQKMRTAKFSRRKDRVRLTQPVNTDIRKSTQLNQPVILMDQKHVKRSAALSYKAWEKELPIDYEGRAFLLSGIKDGFHIVDSETISNYVEVENYRSATAEHSHAQVEKQIYTEIDNGCYRIVNKKPHSVSALGAIPKKNSPDVRLIHDASRPSGSALNDYAINNPFRYQSIQDAVDLVTPGCYFAKLDLSNAFRSVISHSSNHKATGLKWLFQGDKHYTYLIDERLPFGAKKSPQIFNSITQAVREMMKRRGYNTIICYLDDFLIVAQTFSECMQALNELLRLLRRLGFQINYNKLEGPTYHNLSRNHFGLSNNDFVDTRR